MKTDLIDACWAKHERRLSLSWEELARLYGFKTGEQLRVWFKNYRYSIGKVKGLYKNGNKRILHVSDLHYPFNLPIEIFKDYVGKIDILIINGDEQDCQSISKFRKRYRVPFVDELVGTRQMLIDIINYITPKKVILNYGNHNIRMINYFSDKIHEDILQLMPETNLDFICDIGFWKHDHLLRSKTFYPALSEVFKDKVDIVYTRNWYCRVGNTIFAHPKAYKQGILSTTEKAYLYFLQLGEQPFDSIVLAHTHAQGISRYGNTFLIESGCTCEKLSYSSDGSLRRPQSQGFLFLVQNGAGNIQIDKSKLVFL